MGKARRRVKYIIANYFRAGVLFVFLLCLWQVAAGLYPQLTFFVGSPLLIGASLLDYTNSGALPRHLSYTAIEAFSGFMLGSFIGGGIGFGLWYWPRLATAVRPYIKIASVVPVFTFAPLIIIWFGVGISMKIILSGFAVSLVALSGSYEGAQAISEREYLALRLYGASRFQILRVYVLPITISSVFASMRTGVGLAILGAFIGEFISSNVGLGYFMVKSGALYNIPAVLAGAVYLVFLSLLLSGIVHLVDKHRLNILDMIS